MENDNFAVMPTIGGIPRNKFLNTADAVMQRFLVLKENPDKTRTGCYMAIMEDGKMKIVIELLVCQLETADGCFEISQEKVRRLHGHLIDGHMSSWESRVFKNGKYGGAVSSSVNSPMIDTGKEVIGSVSGLVELGDEAVVLVLWVLFKFLTFKEALKIIKKSENHLFLPLHRACKDLNL